MGKTEMNKFWFSMIFLSVVLLIFKILAYNSRAQFLVDIPLLSFAFLLLIKFRKQITERTKRIHLPKYLLYLIVWIPFSIFEENINCLPSGCVPIPSTIPMLFIFGLVLGLFVIIFKAKDINSPLILFSIFGLLFEIFLGGLRGSGFFTPAGLFFSIWTMVGYAFIAIVPLTVLIED